MPHTDPPRGPFKSLVVLGESTVEGGGWLSVPEQRWADLLWKLLEHAQEEPLAYHNAGVGASVISPRSPGYEASIKPSASERLDEEVIAHNPDLVVVADGLNNRAVSMLDLGRKAEAMEFLEKVLRLMPGHPEAMHNRMACRRLARSDIASTWPLLLCQPRVDDVRRETGNLNLRLADPNAILELGEAGLAAALRLFREPKDTDGHLNLNQAALACALAKFAEPGSARARDFLFDVADGRVPLVAGPDGDAALEIAQAYIYGF